ncbi:MAG: D-glycerate dehydrogenase [Deltaproteobacteria bacterium]|nr:MAG: D-glycerate dehydrogenase [Deltaproteobacteria bacterium]
MTELYVRGAGCALACVSVLRLFVARRLAVDPAAFVHPDAAPPIEIIQWNDERPIPRDELLRRVAPADGIVATLSDRIDPELLAIAPRLRVVANHAVGYDNVEIAACTARRVQVCNTPDVLTDATADLTFALILAVARRLHEAERIVREGRWHYWAPTMLLGLELRGALLGIVGYGRIGKAVAARARGFGMEVVWCGGHASGAIPLDDLLSRADVVSIHCPLTPETRHLIGAAQLTGMKRSAILVNTARGPIVDEVALVAALEAGTIAGAGLDVFEDEPRVHPGLVGRDDVVLVPHIGSATSVTRARMAELALTDAARVLRGERPRNPVNEVLP